MIQLTNSQETTFWAHCRQLMESRTCHRLTSDRGQEYVFILCALTEDVVILTT